MIVLCHVNFWGGLITPLKKVEDKNGKRLDREFHSVMSGQFCTIAMFFKYDILLFNVAEP